MKESAIQKKIIDYLESQGCFVIKTISTNKNGIPDILACCGGEFRAYEVKTVKGVVSKLQIYRIKQIQAAGGIAKIVRGVEDV